MVWEEYSATASSIGNCGNYYKTLSTRSERDDSYHTESGPDENRAD